MIKKGDSSITELKNYSTINKEKKMIASHKYKN